ERTPSIGDRNKFGTYHRDQTGLDYADQRYYNSAIGRFLSADPYEASGGATEPANWGRGVDVHGDPVNFNDPLGLYERQVDKDPLKEWLRQHFGMPIYDTVKVPDPNESEREEKAEGIQRFLRSMACNTSPSGRVTTVSVGAGILGTAQVTVDFVLNYNTGNVSAFFGAGVQLGFNPAGASGSVALGFVYGMGAKTSDFMNLSRSVSAGTPSGVGVSYADSSSDGFKTDGEIQSIALQIGFGLNSLKWISQHLSWARDFSFGLGPQGNAPVELTLGPFADSNGFPTPIGIVVGAGIPILPFADAMLYKMRQDCIAEGLIRF
ncbi:MAG: RHS repeat-associated core domain-containing protein, partial [Acidobacteriota bacterium]